LAIGPVGSSVLAIIGDTSRVEQSLRMKSFLAWLEAFTLAIGGPGLFIIAFLDSSFLYLLVVTMVVQHPQRFAYYAVMATLGSVAGCLALYVVGRRGGKALLHTRFGAGRMQRVSRIFQRRGLIALIVAALLPPPAPFKAFVLLGGITSVPIWQFTAAIAIGRGGRFLLIAVLAARYGRGVLDWIAQHGRAVGLTLAVLVAAGAVGWYWWARRRSALTGSS
jgi:membrane protein YqaA with SNARE-associated domain